MDKDVPCNMMEKDIPYVAYEKTNSRWERILKTVLIVFAVYIALSLGTIIYLVNMWTNCEVTDVTVDGQDGGNAAYMGDYASGVINNGEGGSSESETEK